MLITYPFKVALIDDDQTILDMGQRALQQLDQVQTRPFVDGTTALNAIRDEDIRIVISDINMPGMKGDELLRECMALKTGIQFWAMTGGDSIIVADLCLREGARGYLLKPVEIQLLRGVVQDAADHLANWNNLLRGMAGRRAGA